MTPKEENMSNIKNTTIPTFYVISYPDSYWLIPIYIHQFNKYVPNAKCVIMCYEYPELDMTLPDNVKIVSITNGEPQGGITNWASSIRKYFETLNDEYIIFSLDDFLITDPMDIDKFTADLEKVKEYDIKRYVLGDHTCPYYRLEEWNEFLKFKPHSDYRLSCQISVWNREFIIKYLKDGWTPWNFEIEGSKETKGKEYNLVYSPTIILKYLENGAISRKFNGEINVKGMSNEDIEFHTNNGGFQGKPTFTYLM